MHGVMEIGRMSGGLVDDVSEMELGEELLVWEKCNFSLLMAESLSARRESHHLT